MERLIRLAAAIALVGGLASAPPLARAADATFGTPRATATFGTSVTFEQPVTTTGVTRAEVLVDLPGSFGPHVTPVAPPPDGTSTLRHAILLTDGHLYPDTRLTARWRLTLADGSSVVGPDVSVTYADDRFQWQSAESEHVRVFWYVGDAAFGRRALKIGDDAIASAEALLGVTVTDRVDFFVYADEASFYDALGPGSRENVGGTYIPGLQLLFALITPDQINDAWVGLVIPHELTHLVFDTAVDNPYHDPPRWLNEGLAVYVTQGYDTSDRRLVDSAVADNALIPLDGLVGVFPTSFDAFYLAYAESVSAIDYLIRTYGQDALVTLIRSYAEGRTDDEAFSDALGMDATEFNTAWIDDLGATIPERIGPRPDPVGPLPPGWTGAVATPQPGSSAAPSASATPAPGTGAGDDGNGASAPIGPVAVVIVAALAVVIGGWLALRRPSRSRVSPQATQVAPQPPATVNATEPEDDASHEPNA
jgi:hypothetical protein